MKLKRFDAQDWEAFSGAECFIDASDPVIAYDENSGVIVIGDHAGIEVFFDEAAEGKCAFMPGTGLAWTAEIAQVVVDEIARQLPGRITPGGLKILGFQFR